MEKEKWAKRIATCYRKLELFGADVYACIFKDGEYWTLNSSHTTTFPPPDESLVGLIDRNQNARLTPVKGTPARSERGCHLPAKGGGCQVYVQPGESESQKIQANNGVDKTTVGVV